ncbi:MAG: DUF4923 family protein [Anditalea sp.]
MKNNLNLLFLAVLISSFSILVSCGNKDDESPKQDRIVGTWTYSSLDYDATINGQNYITFLVENLGVSEAEAQTMASILILQGIEQIAGAGITFNADGTYVIQDGSSEETGTYSLENNETQLTLNPDDGDTIIFEVTEFTNNSLTLASSEEVLEDLNGDGTDETIEITFDIGFTK